MASSVKDRALLVRAAMAEHPELASDPGVLAELQQLELLLARDPLQSFVPNDAQIPWYEASTRIVAAFAGNRFGKTTSLVVRSLIECVDRESLPRSLQGYKKWDSSNAPRGTHVRIVCPSFALLDANLIDAYRRWAPADQLVGGSFDKAYKGAPTRRLSFVNGSFIEFMVYEQDLDKFGGTARHVVGYDEPPPEDIRGECLMRLADYGGYEMFAVTPLKVNTGWLRKKIYKRREHPDVTVIRGSIHDNPLLDKATVDAALNEGSDLLRRAREFGDFVDMGGLIFPEFEACKVPKTDARLTPKTVRGLEHVVGIDPGVRNCGIVFCGFDGENRMLAFDELLLQDATPEQYVEEIDGVLARWGIPRSRVSFVIDPAARQRAQVNAETVESALGRLGVYCIHGQNNVDAGVQQLRDRMRDREGGRRFHVSEECRVLRDQADEYAAEDRDDGQFVVIKKNDHALDALRYVAMYSPFYPAEEAAAPHRNLGWVPGQATPEHMLDRAAPDQPPMGAFS